MQLKSQIDGFEKSLILSYHFPSTVFDSSFKFYFALVESCDFHFSCQVLRLFQNYIRYYWMQRDVQDLQKAGKIDIIDEVRVN